MKRRIILFIWIGVNSGPEDQGPAGNHQFVE